VRIELPENPLGSNGGYVRSSAPFPGRPGVVAVFGEWSGGMWAGEPLGANQYRASQLVGTWRVVGVDNIARSSGSPALLLEPISSVVGGLAVGDLLMFGCAQALQDRAGET
jgi:hypothetical protein